MLKHENGGSHRSSCLVYSSSSSIIYVVQIQKNVDICWIYHEYKQVYCLYSWIYIVLAPKLAARSLLLFA
jgi:hypothetical protein